MFFLVERVVYLFVCSGGLFVFVRVTRRMELEVTRDPDGDDYADAGLG